MSRAKDVLNLAYDKLAPLLEKGIVTGVGSAGKEGQETLFIGVDLGVDQSDPRYKPELNSIRSQIAHLLDNVPFSILGRYDDDLDAANEDAARDRNSMPKAAALEPPSYTEPQTASLLAEIKRLREAHEGLYESNRRWEAIFKEQLAVAAEARREVDQLRKLLAEARGELLKQADQRSLDLLH